MVIVDVLQRIAQLCLRIGDARGNVIIGFSWKTDLVGLTREFPYRWRDTIVECCQPYRLKQFSELETNALLDLLGIELRATLRKDLRFLLSEFSQGYPWLLKKLCAHVKKQRQAGIPQAEIARGLLNVEQLFLEDLEGLSLQQEEALRRIARLAPVNISEIGEELAPEILQSLVDRRLVVKVGVKCDIYWDIFRDYLNTKKLPVEEMYLLRAQVGSVVKAITILQAAGGMLGVEFFKERAGLSDKAFFNVARDLRLLQLAKIDHDTLALFLSVGTTETEVRQHLRDHLAERLPRNRCVYNTLNTLGEKREIQIGQLAEILRNEFPYISATNETWETYARVLATWLDISDLAVLDEAKSKILPYRVGSQVRDRSLPFAPKRSRLTVPSIQFAPVLQVATRIVSAAQGNVGVDWAGLKRSTIHKALSMLEEMQLVVRKSNTLHVSEECHAFVLNPDRRCEIAKTAARRWPIFDTFLSVLNESVPRSLPHAKIAEALVAKTGVAWKPGTAETNAKIMLDWARHLRLAPKPHADTHRGQFKASPKVVQLSFFDDISDRQNARTMKKDEEEER